jgi:heat shock protein HslJ
MDVRVYLASPEVFLPNAREIGARKQAICERHGLFGVLLIIVGGLALLASGCSSPPQAVTAIFDTVHTSQNSLDWAGAYRGVIPCADCRGIETVVVLKSDGTFTRHFKYLGKGDEVFSKEGRFTWNAAGSTVSLAGDARYLVGENHLTRLAPDGARVRGALADRYVLAKVPEDGVTERYWKLVELNGQPLPKLDREPWLILKADGRMNGFGGCNNFTGSYKLEAATSRLSFGQIATTSMACISGMEVEQAFYEALGNTDNYSLSGDHLTLNRARMAPLARFEAVYLR